MNHNLQALRALAAYMVVGHHVIDGLRNYIAIGRFAANPAIGATGVNIFFVISGFIMMLTTRAAPVTPARFLAHRLVRVAPLYWLLSLVALALLASGLTLFARTTVDLRGVATSFAFLPDIRSAGTAGKPLLFVGWTLNYEMMFYALFAVGLLLPTPRLRCVGTTGAILLLWLAQLAGTNPWAEYWGADIVLAFALGMLLLAPAARHPLPVPLAFAALPLALLGLAAPDLVPGLGLLPHHDLVVTAAAGLLVFAALSLEARGRRVPLGVLTRQGDASYALYLVHPFVLQIAGKAAILSGLNRTAAGLGLVVVAEVAACAVAAMLVHRRIERPIAQALRPLADRLTPQARGAARRRPAEPAPLSSRES